MGHLEARALRVLAGGVELKAQRLNVLETAATFRALGVERLLQVRNLKAQRLHLADLWMMEVLVYCRW